jgi:hypothetical protein
MIKSVKILRLIFVLIFFGNIFLFFDFSGKKVFYFYTFFDLYFISLLAEHFRIKI